MSFQQLQTLSENLNSIDAKQDALNLLKAENQAAYERWLDAWAVESSYNSNKIEGSTLSLGETALVFEGVGVSGHPATDVAQAKGSKAGLEFLKICLAAKRPISEELVREAHQLIYAEALHEKDRGTYRKSEVEITGTPFEPTPSVFVPERMKGLIGSVLKSNKHAAITAALFHLEFESIHPFVNANGRTGRLLANYLLMAAGYEPVNIQASDRRRYIDSLRAFQTVDDPYPFAHFFIDNLERQIDSCAKKLSGSAAPVAHDDRSNAITEYLSGGRD